MEKRIEPLLPKGSNAGREGERGEGGDCMKFSFGKETPRRPRALEDIHICIGLAVLLFFWSISNDDCTHTCLIGPPNS
jgi:hypothetical protein